MSKLLLLLLALTVFIGESLAWPGFLQTPGRRALASFTTVATALTGAHVANVQIQRHRNHLPWYDEDDFWLSVLQLPQSAPQPSVPLPDYYFMDMNIDYVHIWNATSPLSTIVEPDSDLHLQLQNAAYLSNSKAAYVLFKTSFRDTDGDNTPGSSEYNLLDEPFPIHFSFDQQSPSYPVTDFNPDWLAVGLLSTVAAVIAIYIAIKRSHLLLQNFYDNTGAGIAELNHAIVDQSVINQQLNAILGEMTGVFETVIATQQVVCNGLRAAHEASSTRVAALEAALETRKQENDRLESQVESAKATYEAQILAEDELRSSNATNKALAAELESAKETLASRDKQFADLQERWNSTSMSKRLARRQAKRDDSAAASSTESQEGPVVNLPLPPPAVDVPQPESSTNTAAPSPAPAPTPAPALAAPSPAENSSVQQSSLRDSGSKAGLGPLVDAPQDSPADAPQYTSVDAPEDPLADAPRGPKIDPNTLSHSNKTMNLNPATKKRDRTNAPLAEPSSSSSSSSSRPFTVPKLTKAEEKKAIAESVERVKRRAEAARQQAEQEKK